MTQPIAQQRLALFGDRLLGALLFPHASSQCLSVRNRGLAASNSAADFYSELKRARLRA